MRASAGSASPSRRRRSSCERVAGLRGISVRGVYTHLPFVDRAGLDWADARLPAFRTLVSALAHAGLQPEVTQALSSAGILAGLEDGCTAVCPGHVLYGLPPSSPEAVDFSAFQPVLRAVKTRAAAGHAARRHAHRGGRRAGRARGWRGHRSRLVRAHGRLPGSRRGPAGVRARARSPGPGPRRVARAHDARPHRRRRRCGRRGRRPGHAGERDDLRAEIASWQGCERRRRRPGLRPQAAAHIRRVA